MRVVIDGARSPHLRPLTRRSMRSVLRERGHRRCSISLELAHRQSPRRPARLLPWLTAPQFRRPRPARHDEVQIRSRRRRSTPTSPRPGVFWKTRLFGVCITPPPTYLLVVGGRSHRRCATRRAAPRNRCGRCHRCPATRKITARPGRPIQARRGTRSSSTADFTGSPERPYAVTNSRPTQPLARCRPCRRRGATISPTSTRPPT